MAAAPEAELVTLIARVCTTDAEASVRRRAIRAVTEVQARLPELANALYERWHRDPDQTVRLAALDLLANVLRGTDAGWRLLASTTRFDDSDCTRRYAIDRTVQDYPQHADLSALLQETLRRDAQGSNRLEALRHLASLSEQSTSSFVSRLGITPQPLRRLPVSLLAEVALRDPDATVAGAAMSHLASPANADGCVRNVLLDVAEFHPNEAVRAMAVRLLTEARADSGVQGSAQD